MHPNLTTKRAARAMARGFSMLELTFVLVVIGVLLATAAINYKSFMIKGKIAATKNSLKTIKGALESYNAQNSTYPASLSSLIPEFLERGNTLKDGWRVEFYYAVVADNVERGFDLRSAGPDNVMGTVDDIDVWNPDNDTQRS